MQMSGDAEEVEWKEVKTEKNLQLKELNLTSSQRIEKKTYYLTTQKGLNQNRRQLKKMLFQCMRLKKGRYRV